MVETELKLALIAPPARAHAVWLGLIERWHRRQERCATAGRLHHRPTPTRTELYSAYWDTPDLTLAQGHAALRVRRVADRFIMTLKGAPNPSADATAHLTRLELEAPIASDAPCRATLEHWAQHQPLAREVLQHFDALRPAFVTVFTRHAIVCELPPARTRQGASNAEAAPEPVRCEITLDLGEVSTAHGRAPLQEVEIEVLSGSRRAWLAWVQSWLNQRPLKLRMTSKAHLAAALSQPEGQAALAQALTQSDFVAAYPEILTRLELAPYLPPALARAARNTARQALRQHGIGQPGRSGESARNNLLARKVQRQLDRRWLRALVERG